MPSLLAKDRREVETGYSRVLGGGNLLRSQQKQSFATLVETITPLFKPSCSAKCPARHYYGRRRAEQHVLIKTP